MSRFSVSFSSQPLITLFIYSEFYINVTYLYQACLYLIGPVKLEFITYVHVTSDQLEFITHMCMFKSDQVSSWSYKTHVHAISDQLEFIKHACMLYLIKIFHLFNSLRLRFIFHWQNTVFSCSNFINFDFCVLPKLMCHETYCFKI